MRQTQGSETSQYLEEEKSKEIPSVAASERGGAQTDPTTKCQLSVTVSVRERKVCSLLTLSTDTRHWHFVVGLGL